MAPLRAAVRPFAAGPWSFKVAVLLAAGALALSGLERLHVRWQQRNWSRISSQALRSRLEAVESRKQRLVARLQSAADRAAALPDARPALAGDRAALSRLFRALETLGGGREDSPALAVHALPVSTIAWAGRSGDMGGLAVATTTRRGVFALAGSVTTTLVAVAEIPGPDNRPLGLATAEGTVKVQRNIRNEYLKNFDLLAGSDPGLEIHYRDPRDPAPAPFTTPPPGTPSLEGTLLAPDGLVLAAVRVTATPREDAARALALAYRRAISACGWAALLCWTLATGPVWPGSRLRLALGATALRLTTLALGPPLPWWPSPLLSPDVFASTLLGPFLQSPLDLLLTALWFLLLAGLLLEQTLAFAPRVPSWWRAGTAALLAFALLGAVFAWIADTSANCSLDLETITIVPRSAPHLVLQVSLLAILGTGGLLLVALLSRAGPWPRSPVARLGQAATWALLGTLSFRFWPDSAGGLPLLPALGLFLLAAALAARSASWRAWAANASAGARAGGVLAAVAALSVLLYPSLAYYAQRETRQRIELSYAPLILRQPQWREYLLGQAQRRIDGLDVLGEGPPGPTLAEVEELAFSVWSATDLAAFGLSSAVEIQDRAGAVISRFALNLPSVSVAGSTRSLPTHERWRVSQERLTFASAERRVLHARRRLVYHGETRGAIHLYIAEDLWNLPFIPARDPYSFLYRPEGRRASLDQPATVVVYDVNRAVAFSSTDRPPALGVEFAQRLDRQKAGFWTVLPVDGRPHNTFLFSDGQADYALGFPRLGPGRYAADLVEAAATFTLLGLVLLVLLMLARSLFRRPTFSLFDLVSAVRRRFALRLFVAFVAVALLPVAVLEVVVRRFVATRLHRESEDQALERAAVARKAIEDFAYFQRGEAPGHEPVTDAALVWVASLIRNDLDVFGRGRILASSKRELYASGLLPPRVSGSVFRALVLDQVPTVLRTETIGSFSTLVASVPVKLQGVEPGILSIPLGLRQREVRATLDDLDRATRLASLIFLALAAGLAQSMARRISGPLRDLTGATRRVAEGDLLARVTTSARDELRELVDAFNQMARDLERQRVDLERSNRLAAWAEMARQVAHEVKNPLTPIQLSAEHLQRVFRDGSADFAATLEACAATILKQVQTLRRIVTEFSAFARPPGAELLPEDLSAVVRETLAPYALGLPPGVQIAVDAPAGLPRARLDRRLVERAVLNLVENALQAVGERGVIAVRLRAGTDRVEVEVSDSGPGIEPEVRDRIFEPFFSTKTGGSGLGLALVKKIAEDHGGGVSLETAAGKGTCARLWFPAQSDGTERPEAERPSAPQ